MMRRHVHRLGLAAALVAAAGCSGAWAQATGPYDENANAEQQIQQAQDQAVASQRPLLIVFGANWCGDCKVLDAAFQQGRVAALMKQNFTVVKVDVGRFNRNVGIAERYGVPLKKGIPAVALVSPDGKTLYNTQAGELADARGMGEPGLYDFFARLAAQRR